MDEPSIILTGSSGSKYLVGGQIAEGSFSKVYSCDLLDDNERVVQGQAMVAKIMKVHSCSTEIDVTQLISNKCISGFPKFKDWGNLTRINAMHLQVSRYCKFIVEMRLGKSLNFILQ